MCQNINNTPWVKKMHTLRETYVKLILITLMSSQNKTDLDFFFCSFSFSILLITNNLFESVIFLRKEKSKSSHFSFLNVNISLSVSLFLYDNKLNMSLVCGQNKRFEDIILRFEKD